MYYTRYSKKNTIIYSALWSHGNTEAFRWPRRDFYGSKAYLEWILFIVPVKSSYTIDMPDFSQGSTYP